MTTFQIEQLYLSDDMRFVIDIKLNIKRHVFKRDRIMCMWAVLVGFVVNIIGGEDMDDHLMSRIIDHLMKMNTMVIYMIPKVMREMVANTVVNFNFKSWT
jgi:hypothetical protein